MESQNIKESEIRIRDYAPGGKLPKPIIRSEREQLEFDYLIKHWEDGKKKLQKRGRGEI